MTRLAMPGLTSADHGRTLCSCLPRFTFPAHFLFLWQRLPQLAQSLAHLHKIYNWCLCDNLLSVGHAPQHVGRWSSSLTGLEWIFLRFFSFLYFRCLLAFLSADVFSLSAISLALAYTGSFVSNPSTACVCSTNHINHKQLLSVCLSV
ncbi:hypothetical protein NP493_525g02022 [Ridgeia piscesae]|uniref:Uncharacterized protein n=1 Tax=Ridgeia piscesae TaxID=27915 RepID=A0AAD9KWT5_RIDPI|nr:hypothetical protein NP493_525g02022 [Ridgeia piscesae]